MSRHTILESPIKELTGNHPSSIVLVHITGTPDVDPFVTWDKCYPVHSDGISQPMPYTVSGRYFSDLHDALDDYDARTKALAIRITA